MDESLSSILTNDKAPVEAPPQVVEKDVKPVEVVQTTVDTAAPSAAKEEIQPTEKKEPLKPAEIAAIIDERRKRQEAERELAELRSKVKPEDKPDFYADPDKAVEVKVQQAIAPIKEKFFKQSIAAAASAHSDFEQVAEVFAGLVDKDPALRAEWLASDDPGDFIYRVGTNTPEHREKFAADLKGQLSEKDARIAALTQELEAVKKGQAELAAVPKSLNNVATSAPKAADTEDEGIESIVRFKTG